MMKLSVFCSIDRAAGNNSSASPQFLQFLRSRRANKCVHMEQKVGQRVGAPPTLLALADE
jgi:hypothetical protein